MALRAFDDLPPNPARITNYYNLVVARAFLTTMHAVRPMTVLRPWPESGWASQETFYVSLTPRSQPPSMQLSMSSGTLALLFRKSRCRTSRTSTQHSWP